MKMSITSARKFYLATVGLFLVTCTQSVLAADWPMFRHDANHTGRTAERVTGTMKHVWSTKLGDKILSSPAVVGGVVYVGSREKVQMRTEGTRITHVEMGALNAVNAKTGKLLWKYVGTSSDPMGWVDSSPAVAGGVIYFCARDGYLYAVTTQGHLKWKYHCKGTNMSSPLVLNGVVYFGSGFPNKEVFAVDAATGKPKWKFETGQMVYSSPAASEGIVYIGSDDGKFYALQAQTGSKKWAYDTTGGVYFSSPMVANGIAYCVPGDYDKNIYAVNASTGKTIWKVSSDSTNNYVCSPALGDGVVYAGTGMPQQKLYALDLKNGKEKWNTLLGSTTGQMFTSSPAVSGKVLFVGAGAANSGEPGSGRILALDAATGKIRGEIPTDEAVVSSPAISNGMLFVGSLGGTLYGVSVGSESSTKAHRKQ